MESILRRRSECSVADKRLEVAEQAWKPFASLRAGSVILSVAKNLALRFLRTYEILPSLRSGPPAAPQNDSLPESFNNLLAQSPPSISVTLSLEVRRSRRTSVQLSPWLAST